MNKIAIPALLVATVMVAGMFAFAPVEQASTVHTTAASTENSIKYVTVTATCPVTDGDADDCDDLVIDVAEGAVYSIVSGQITATEVGAGALDIQITSCTQGGAEAINVAIDPDTGAVGNDATVVANDSQGITDTVSIGLAGTDDITCAITATTSDDDTVVIELVLKINADADDPTVTTFDDA